MTSYDMNKYAGKKETFNKPILMLHLRYSQNTNSEILKLSKTVK